MENVHFIILSIVVGLLPETVYFTLFFTFSKGLRDREVVLFKRNLSPSFGIFLLFCLIFISNLILSAFFAFSVWYHFLFMVSMWVILRVLYRSQVVDVFLILMACIVLTAQSVFFLAIFSQSVTTIVLSRICLILSAFVLRKWWIYAYEFYLSVWNRGMGGKIKSVTARCIVIVSMNILIFVLDLIIRQVYIT